MKTLLVLFIMITMFVVNSESLAEVIIEPEDRTGLQLIIYQGGTVMVVDSRKCELPAPKGSVAWKDVASSLQPDSMDIQTPAPLQLIRRQFQSGTVQSRRLLELYTGREVVVISGEKDLGVELPFTAVLLGIDQNKAILQADRDIIFVDPDNLRLPDYQGELNVHPLIRWDYRTEEEYAGEISVSYLAQNLDWKADYLFILPEEGDSGRLQGWITIQNNGNDVYPDARIQVVAGVLHRVRQPRASINTRAYDMVMAESAAPLQETALFDYYTYAVPDHLDIEPRQNTQVLFLQADEIDFEKEYLVINRNQQYFRSSYPGKDTVPVEIFLAFTNEEDNQLGRPFPAGIIRFYQEDSHDQRMFIGEDQVPMTPKDETLRMKTGQAFDLVARRNQTEYNRISQNVYETTWEIKLTNRKNEQATFGVVENFPASWTLLESSHEYTRLDAFTVRYDVPVAGGEEETVRYRVRIDYSR